MTGELLGDHFGRVLPLLDVPLLLVPPALPLRDEKLGGEEYDGVGE